MFFKQHVNVVLKIFLNVLLIVNGLILILAQRTGLQSIALANGKPVDIVP